MNYELCGRSTLILIPSSSISMFLFNVKLILFLVVIKITFSTYLFFFSINVEGDEEGGEGGK